MNGSIAVLVFIVCLNGIYSSPWTDSEIYFIYGGHPVLEAELPFVVSLQEYSGNHICGGNIITRNVVLTAAHCVLHYPKKVVAGVVDFTDSSDRQERDIVLSSVKMHPRFGPGSLYDIAVFKVSYPFDFKYTLQPAVIENLKIPDYFWFPGKVAGWGWTEDKSSSSILLSADIRILSQRNCYNELGDEAYEGLICALPRSRNEDACQGDSGGPLLYYGKLVGIISTGFGCGRSDVPSVYTNVSYFSRWIHDNI